MGHSFVLCIRYGTNMKTIITSQTVITIRGPRGKLTRSFRAMQLEMTATKNKKNETEIKITKWFGTRKQVAAVRTVCSHIQNMVKGVTKGYQYKMRAVYAHFPIN